MGRVTDYGFNFGPMLVERLARFAPRKGREVTVLKVQTDHHTLNIYASRTGRSVRVYKDGKELT